MNRIFTLLFSLIFTSAAIAQVSFSDDFDSYSPGDYIGVESDTWSTWSGAVGGSEDARVVGTQAASGSNSIYFSSTAAGGGPQDVVLPFGAKYTTGLFTLSMNVYVSEGAGAYWNFQGETTIGTTWSHNCYMLSTGELQFSNGDNGLALSTTYEFGKWINIQYEINLTDNAWKVSVDGECLGSFSNSANAVASMDLFPTQGNAFYVDDVSFTYDPEVPSRLYDASLAVSELGIGGLTGMTQTISATVKNLGSELINSVDVEVLFADGPQTFTFDNLGLANGGSANITIPQDYVIAEGTRDIAVDILSINGDKTDEDPCNSRATGKLLGITPAVGKGVLIEEGTGTWCGWCPRGAVFLDRLVAKYGDRFVGVAVHNGDPMVVTGYDGQHGFSGYPGATVMRRSTDTGFGTMGDLELPFLDYIAQAPKGTFDVGAKYDDATATLSISSNITANVNLDSGSRIAMILTEDDVTGTASGYNQANYYAGGGNGAMGGYESLPGTVPAANMVYDHVARAIPLGFAGEPTSFENTLNAGESRVYNYGWTIDSAYELEQMHIVMVIVNSDGSIDNAHQVKVTDALANGFVTSGIAELLEASTIQLYPNPASAVLNIAMQTELTATVNVRIVDALGQTVISDQFATNSGNNTHSLNISSLGAGAYYAVLVTGEAARIIQFVKE